MQKSDSMWAESAASLKTATGCFQNKTNKNICLNALDEDEAAAKHSR